MRGRRNENGGGGEEEEGREEREKRDKDRCVTEKISFFSPAAWNDSSADRSG
jgi:hypothetical protein